MTAPRRYLDWNASAPLRPEARAAVIGAMDLAGNPSSVHAEGRKVRAVVEDAREAVATLVGAAPAEVIFTSGASEANAWVLGQGWDTIFFAPSEHDSVVVPAEESGARIVELPLGPDGVVAVEGVAEHALKGGVPIGKGLVALQAANNETGAVQPIEELAAFAAGHGLAVLCDAVQAAGRMPLSFRDLDIEFMTVSAHKLGGPKGVGALVVRDGTELAPLIAGGGQERRRRAGTENVAAIAGFGAAAAAARDAMAREAAHVDALRARLERELLALTPQAVIVARSAPRLANTTCVALPGALSEVLVAALDLAGIGVSAGSACSSGKVTASRTLAAMGLDPDLAAGAIRISLGRTTTDEDIAAFLAAWNSVAGARRRAA